MFAKKQLVAAALLTIAASSANALTIGHFDTTRELYGLSGDYISGARQALLDAGHTLVAVNSVDAARLAGVDAFYTGLISSVSGAEIIAFRNFVNVQGGFLFIQQDYSDSPWHAASSQILNEWGIGNSVGSFSNDAGHYSVGTSTWVTDPNTIVGISGAQHSTINVIPVGFEVLMRDSANRAIAGVFDAGAGRSSDVFVATDIDFWSDAWGWNDVRNRNFWQNIWTGAARQIEPPTGVPLPGSLALLGLGLFGLAYRKRKFAG
jgi:PEP-CTERM motif